MNVLSLNWPVNLSRLLLFLLVLAIVNIPDIGTATAGARPGSKNAACDSIALRYRSKADRITERELNFFLFDSAAQGCKELTTEILDSGASVGARDRFGNSALLIAARMGHNDILDLLMERGSDVHQVNLAGSSALLRAVTMNRRKTVARLLEAGVDANLGNSREVTPLVSAAFGGNTRIVKMLLEHGAKPDVTDASGKGPLVYAAGKGFLPMVKLLLETGKIDVNTAYGNNLTALMWAAGHSNDVPENQGLAIVDHILSLNADIHAVDNRGRTALMIAAGREHHSIVQRLLEAGADSTITDKEGKSAIDLAGNNLAIANTIREFASR